MTGDDGYGRAVSALAHDVGKYVARTAKNVSGNPNAALPEVLISMLVRDLFALDGTRPASAVLEERARAHPRLTADARVTSARARLAEVDALEARVRAGQPEAIRQACAAAREVESLLRALARDAAEER